MTTKTEGRLGRQPVKAMIGRRVPHVAEQLSAAVGYRVPARTLAAWSDGRSVPPAEVKIGVAELLGVEPERAWTPACLESVYVGPRGFGS